MATALTLAGGLIAVLLAAALWLARDARREARRLQETVLGLSAKGTARRDPPTALAPLMARTRPPEGAAALQIRQKGRMRFSGSGPWSAFTARQIFALDRFGFVWDARIDMAPGVWMRVLDAYDGERGVLVARLFGLIPVMRAEGADMDRGEAQRYLAELAWNAGAFGGNRDLVLQAGEDGVRASHADIPGTDVVLRLDADGAIVESFAPRRPMRQKEGSVELPWRGSFSDWEEIDGVFMPRRGAVAWIMPEGPFEYWRGEIVSAGYLDTGGAALA